MCIVSIFFFLSIDIKENLALSVLRRWHELPYIGYCLVPEHVETRSLYRRDKPGVAQVSEPNGILYNLNLIAKFGIVLSLRNLKFS